MNKVIRIALVLWVACANLVNGQPKPVETENALLWEISGNGLTKPSYLFGTFHLLDNRFADSLALVMEKVNRADAVVGEIVMDSSYTMKVMRHTIMKGTSLDKLLSTEDYQKTKVWLKELMGYDLEMFKSFNPLTVQIILMAALQQKHYPMNPFKDVPMDAYFQQVAKKQNKGVIGLETLEDQIGILFGQFSLERQAEILSEYVNDQEKARREIAAMNVHYRSQELAKLEEMMNDQWLEENERLNMVDNRNKKWAEKLPEMMKQQSLFVAVGALHLPGKNGVINLLRQQGFTLRALNPIR